MIELLEFFGTMMLIVVGISVVGWVIDKLG